MEQVLILSADKWEMPDERTGEIRSGLSLWFLSDYREDSQESFGYKPAKVTAPLELLDKVRGKLPGFFEMVYGSKPGAQGKAQLTLIDVKAVKGVTLFPKATAAA